MKLLSHFKIKNVKFSFSFFVCLFRHSFDTPVQLVAVMLKMVFQLPLKDDEKDVFPG